MARGELNAADQAIVAAAVARAERATGLQLCVLFCRPDGRPPREQAESTFAHLELHAVPAVLVLVVAASRQVEIVTSAAAQARLPDAAAAEAIAAMVPHFTDGHLADAIAAGLATITAAVGAGPPDPAATDLPDVVDAT